VGQPVEEQLEGSGRRARRPALAVDDGRHRLGVEQQRRQLDGGDPVDHAVVRLADQPDRAVVELVGDPHLPQRTLALQRHRHHGVDDRVEVAGAGVHQVAVDVEVGVIHPRRLADAEGDRRQTLAIARRAADPRGDVVAQLIEIRARAVRRRFEDRGPADVHMGRRALDF